jgi:protein-L-isoaspartate O-methyltransferase
MRMSACGPQEEWIRLPDGTTPAMLAELTHSNGNGNVVSIDVDPEMTQRATGMVAAAGYANVTCITADGPSRLATARRV